MTAIAAAAAPSRSWVVGVHGVSEGSGPRARSVARSG